MLQKLKNWEGCGLRNIIINNNNDYKYIQSFIFSFLEETILLSEDKNSTIRAEKWTISDLHSREGVKLVNNIMDLPWITKGTVNCNN